jgi:hypothetical protein
MSAAIALALTVALLLLEAPGGALAQGAGRGRRAGNNVLKRSKPTPADLDRSILVEWRDGSPQLQRVWSDDDAPVSAWEGVTVGAEGRVVKIELSGKDLTGDVPAALGGLTALEVLSLKDNQLTGVSKQLGKLTTLEVLDLSENQLTSVPEKLGELTALEVLRLHNNQLTSVPAEFGKLAALKTLSLSWNQLTSVPAELGKLTALKTEGIDADLLGMLDGCVVIAQRGLIRSLNVHVSASIAIHRYAQQAAQGFEKWGAPRNSII